MGILCIFSGHNDRIISLSAIKVFPLALESAWASVAASAGGWAGIPLRVERKGWRGRNNASGAGGRQQRDQLTATWDKHASGM